VNLRSALQAPVPVLLLRWPMTAEIFASDLRGRRFVGARLGSASLQGRDVRGADFSGADLRGADLSHIRAGMSRGWAALLVVGSLALSIALGAVVGSYARFLHSMYASDDVRGRLVVVFVVVAVLAFLIAGIWKGLWFATRRVLPVAAALAIAAGAVGAISGIGTGASGLLALAFLGLAVVIVALSVLARATAGTTGGLAFTIVAMAGGLAGGAAGGGVIAAAVAIGAMVMARRSVRLDAGFPALSRVTTAVTGRGGTRFRNANLTGANLEHAQLVACDFRGANLRDARLDRATVRLCRFDRVDPPPGA
jgi:hypothetical protein